MGILLTNQCHTTLHCNEHDVSLFFFSSRRRHTRFDCDWSSDVCSSDLLRNTLLDDRDLAQLVKRSGFRLRMIDGRDLVHVYMYRGLRDIWLGWRKNVFLGSRGGIAFTLLQLAGLPMVSIVPFLLPLMLWMNRLTRKPLVGRQNGEDRITSAELGAATLLELVPLLAYKRWVDKELDIPWYYAFTFPLAGVLFEGILAQSTWRVLSGRGVDWRGRQYYNADPKII